MSVYDKFCGAAFAFKALFIPDYRRFYRQLKMDEMLKGEERREYILRRLQSIVKYAYEQSPFYRRLYDSVDFSPDDLKSISDFEKLPTVGKSDLQAHSQEFFTRDTTPEMRNMKTTGGSTGVPVSVYHDRRVPIMAVEWWLLNKWGLNPGSSAGCFLRYKPKRRLLNSLMWFPTRRVFGDATLISEESCRSFYEECRRAKVRYLCGYVGALMDFSEFMRKHKLSIPTLRTVWTTSAPLTEFSRRQMTEIFGCPTFSQYGCCEMFWLGAECPELSGLHQFDTLRYLEVVDSQFKPLPTEQYGEVLLTDMTNRVFPLIRYRNGDCAAWSSKSCPCGSNFPLLLPVKGRTTDMIRLPSGRVLSGDYLTTLFDAYPFALSAFQVVQHRDLSLTIRCVPLSAEADAVVKKVAGDLSDKIQNEVPINTVMEEHIDHDRGKFRYVVREQ